MSVGVLRGYMNAAFLTEDPLASAAVKSAMPVMKVNAPSGSVNLRKGQSTSSASLGTLKNGTEVVLMGFTNTWAHVIVNGKMGFIMGIYLK